MKKDIQIPVVKNVALVVAKEKGLDNEDVYNVYLINRREAAMEQVLIMSRGFKQESESEEAVKTSVLRHHFESIPSQAHTKIEALIPELFCFTNEYVITFWEGSQLYDKKFVFVPGAIRDENMIFIRELELDGIEIS